MNIKLQTIINSQNPPSKEMAYPFKISDSKTMISNLPFS